MTAHSVGIPIALLACIAVMHPSLSSLEAQQCASDAAEEILSIHRALLASHLEGDAEGVLAAEADDIIVVSHGEVFSVLKEERARQFSDYLEHSKFVRYRDAIAPIVHVSGDGTMGWLIAQVEIAGIKTGDDGKSVPIESTWSWIELYEKRGGRWVRVGEVSSMKPPSDDGRDR